MAKYDEDLNENSFFKAQLNFLKTLEDVVVLLVPQVKSVPLKQDLTDLKGHIVVQNSEEEFQNLNGDLVIIEESTVKIGGLQVPILFKETHYGQDWEKVKVLCIQRPLSEPSFEFHNDDAVGMTITIKISSQFYLDLVLSVISLLF